MPARTASRTHSRRRVYGRGMTESGDSGRVIEVELAVDLEPVMQIINRSFPLTEHDVETVSPVPRQRSRHIGIRIGAMVIFVLILGSVVGWEAVYVLRFLANLL